MLIRLIHGIEQLNETIGHAFAWCIVILAVGTAYEVFVRYLRNDPTSWALDLSYLMYGALFYMASAYPLARGDRVRPDMFYRRWTQWTQAVVEPGLYLLLMVSVGAALIALPGFAVVQRCLVCLRDAQWPARLHAVHALHSQILKHYVQRSAAAPGAAA